MIDLNLILNLKYSMFFCCQIRDIFSIYTLTRNLYEFTKTINIIRVGTPQPFLFKILTQWCMTGLNFTPYFKYSKILCYQNRDIFITDIPTTNRTVHNNDKHVQGWNPTTIRFENRTFKKTIIEK